MNFKSDFQVDPTFYGLSTNSPWVPKGRGRAARSELRTVSGSGPRVRRCQVGSRASWLGLTIHIPLIGGLADVDDFRAGLG